MNLRHQRYLVLCFVVASVSVGFGQGGAPAAWTTTVTDIDTSPELTIEWLAGEGEMEVMVEGVESVWPEGEADEYFRPQFHFTSPANWINDPNGTFFADGLYHLYYQHNPWGTQWGNMHWGHATSPDLFHWTHHPLALTMETHCGGDHCFSGMCYVDTGNVSGLQVGAQAPVLAFYTVCSVTTGAQSQWLAFSVDGGYTFEPVAGNPILPADYGDDFRDPKVFWHAASNAFVMAVYRSGQTAFYRSTDLLSWTFSSETSGEPWFECPDLFALDAPDGSTAWVLLDASGKYALGDFDGYAFQQWGEGMRNELGTDFYATATWENEPNGRRIQVAFSGFGGYPATGFTNHITLPTELTLEWVQGELRLCKRPVEELAALLTEGTEHSASLVAGDSWMLPPFDQRELRIRYQVHNASVDAAWRLNFRGQTWHYDHLTGTLTWTGNDPWESSSAVVAPFAWGPMAGELISDRSSLEHFAGIPASVVADVDAPSPEQPQARLVPPGSAIPTTCNNPRLWSPLGTVLPAQRFPSTTGMVLLQCGASTVPPVRIVVAPH